MFVLYVTLYVTVYVTFYVTLYVTFYVTLYVTLYVTFCVTLYVTFCVIQAVAPTGMFRLLHPGQGRNIRNLFSTGMFIRLELKQLLH